MAALTVQNFVSAATGVAIAVALSRAFARTGSGTIGNFWADLTRITFYVLLPVSFVAALFFVWQGVPQTLSAYVDAATVEGGKQTIALGPVASQLSIKMFGTNGGGFFNANSAHPFENPTALSNFVQMVLIFALGAALTNVFGRIVGDERQGWALLAAMGVLFIAGVLFTYWSESGLSPALAAAGVDPAGGNMEGKEVRFGIAATSLFAVITTAASCGAVNGMHDSFTALGGMIPLINILLGEIIVGGVGTGLYGMLVFCILGVFIAGLMVGRTPEYVGKKIEAREIKMAMIAILAPALAVLGAMGLAAVLPAYRPACRIRSARLHRDALCRGVGSRQQRQRLRRPHRQLAVLEQRPGGEHVHRPLRHHRARAGHRRLARGQAQDGAGPGHAADARAAVGRPAGRRHPDRRRADVPSGAHPWSDRRTLRRRRRQALLSGDHCHGFPQNSPAWMAPCTAPP